MKNRFLAVGLIAAMMVPAVAQAQSREIRDDRRELREDRRELRQAQRWGDRSDVREERRELRDTRREYREDRRDYRQDRREDRRDWRRDRRYSDWRAPFRYHRFGVGATLRPRYYAPSYRPQYDNRWNLPRAGRNRTYVRHYNDLLLVNERNGRVIRVYRNHFRWR